MKHNDLITLSALFTEFNEATKKAEHAIHWANSTKERYEYFVHAVDQYTRFGHLRNDVAAAQGCTWFGDFTCTREIGPAKASASYYLTRKYTALREYVECKRKLTAALTT